ncbi:MAG: hypothetical protein JO027_14460 [Solirubrobacterales bacterium]|nr:hypothetical protein [Solirubrobacterales bacterium]
MSEQLSMPAQTAPPARDRFASSRHDHDELADAEGLIGDLAALVEAGLVAVHEHVLGPARYGLASPEVGQA